MAARFLLRADFWKSGGPIIGPRGGKWADAAHTIPWKESGAEDKSFWNRRADQHDREVQAIKKRLKERHGGVFEEYLGMGAKQGNKLLIERAKHAVAMGAAKAGRVPTQKEINDAVTEVTKKWSAQSKSEVLQKSGGPFIGPRGGKWADPEHKIPWKGPGAGTAHGGFHPYQWSSLGEKFQKVGEASDNPHIKARSHALAEMAHYYASGGKDPAEAAKLYNYRLAKQGHPPDDVDAEAIYGQLTGRMGDLYETAQGSAPAASAPPATAVPEKKAGPPQFPGEQLSAGDHIIVGKHKFQVVEAPVFDANKSHVIGQNYFKLKVKKPTGSKVFEAQVRDAQGSPFWNVTDKGKQVVGGYSGGDEGHQKVSAETKAPKHEAVKQEAIGKANEHDIDAVPTGLASAWHKRWSFGTQPEPVSGSLNKMIANYLVRQHEKGMSAEDHMAAASFHQKYGAEVMSGAKLPSLPHKTARSHRQQLHGALADFHEKMATNSDFMDKVYAIAGKKPKVKKSFSGIDGISEYLDNSCFEEIDMAKNSLEKAFPPPGAGAPPTQGIGPGQAPVPPGGTGGAYTRRWKGPAGKWLYESDHPDHKAAIDASNIAETHPGTAGDLVAAHQNATQAHIKAAGSLKEDPNLSAEHFQVGADHAKAAAIVTTNHFAPGQQSGQPQPGMAPPQPGQPPLAKGPVPPGQPLAPGQQLPPPGQVPPKPGLPPPAAGQPVPPQPGQMAPPQPKPAPAMPPAQPQAAIGAPQVPQPDPGMKTVPTNPGGGQAPYGPPKPGQPVPEKKENPFQKKGKENPFQKKGKVEKSLEAIEQLDEYLEKAGGVYGGDYSRRWRGANGKWRYEYPDSVKDKWAVAHRSAIDASQAAEAAKPGNASVLAHKMAERDHWAAAEQFSHHPDMSGAHMAVSDQHRKAWQGMQKQTSMAAAKGKGSPAAKQVAEFLKKDKVIGKTEDGKPIHSAMSREHYSAASVGWRANDEMRKQRPDYHKYDHRDAAAAHKKEAEQARKLSERLHDEIASQYGGNVFTKDDYTGLYRDEAPEKLRQKLEAIEEYAKTAYDASRNHAVASGNMFAPEEGETYGGVPYQPEERKKSMSGIDALDEYLAKAQSMPEGGPKEKLGVGEEQGGDIDGVGETSGEDDSDSKQPGAPSVPEDVLSEDDDKVADQLKPGKKPIETAKSMATPQNQRDLVRKEVAQAVSELRKSQDVEFGRGIASEHGAPAPRPEGIIWNQGADALVSYGNQADLAASELAKSEGFYHGESPQVAPTSLFLSQRVRCAACHNLMAKSLAVCPSCGEGAQRTLQDVVNTSEREQSAQGSRAGMLRPARTQGDVYFPGGK